MQTARSPEDINRHLAEVRAATAASVDAVGRIGETIVEIESIASSIAAALEQQGARPRGDRSQRRADRTGG